MRIGKFFSNCAQNKKIHSSGYRNRYTTAFTPRNRNRVTATVTATATAIQNLAYSGAAKVSIENMFPTTNGYTYILNIGQTKWSCKFHKTI